MIRADTPLEQAARCALVSINSTIRSVLTVGPPVELLLHAANALDGGRLLLSDDPLLPCPGRRLDEGLRLALNGLPPFEWGNQPQPLQVVGSAANRQMQG